MKRILLILFSMLTLAGCPVTAPAQYMGTFSQQTVAQSFSGTMTALATHVDLQNLGQAGHSITVSAPSCDVTLDGSADGTNWTVLAASLANPGPATVFANGYWTHLRLTFNYAVVAACNGVAYNVQYTGFQFPIPTSPFEHYAVGTTYTAISVGAASQPNSTTQGLWQLIGFTCTNPNASTAYLQVVDSNTAALGANEVYEAAIPANSQFQYAGPPVLGSFTFVLGATTTSRGSTVVTTSLACSVQTGQAISFINGDVLSP